MAGIGGVSMSGLARALLDLGYAVTGSDMAESPTLQRLRAAGAQVHVGHAAENLAGADLVVRSTAVLDSNPELVAARQAGLPVHHRSELLAWMCRGKHAVAVTGTHGKSTTTAMTATVFMAAGKDPTVFVGAESPLLGGNYRLGRGDCIIFEACESDGSFLNYHGCSQVITSVEADHLDQHRDMNGVMEAFRGFARIADPQGYVVYNGTSPRVVEVVADTPARRIPFGAPGDTGLWAREPRIVGDGCEFALMWGEQLLGAVRLPVIGQHNVMNALAALGCALGSGLDMEAACEALADYQPIGRRFEELGRRNGVWVVDDYAHHPTAIRATLAAARCIHPGRIVAVFQPHLRSRTRDLLSEFGVAFHEADVVILTDIYQPREDGLGDFDVTSLVEAVRANEPGKCVELVRDKSQIAAYLRPRLQEGDLVLTIGAGDVWKVGKELVEG